jgi:phospholipid-binding lipoprotein MlaA
MSQWLGTALALPMLVTGISLGTPAAADDTAGGVGAVATPAAPDEEGEELEAEIDPAERDPWEPANRVVFGVNEFLDTVLFDPITEGYQFVVPEPARRCVRRLFINLNSPSVLVNDLLQLRFQDAATTAGRLVVNTAIGWGGMFDAAIELGLESHHSDFGQTLARAGVKSGPYVVLPVFGPSTVRDGFGDLVDRMFQPLTYLLGPTSQIVLGTGNGLAIRDENDEKLEALEESSLDFYAVLRSAYFQHRDAEIWGHTYVDAAAAVNLAAHRVEPGPSIWDQGLQAAGLQAAAPEGAAARSEAQPSEVL